MRSLLSPTYFPQNPGESDLAGDPAKLGFSILGECSPELAHSWNGEGNGGMELIPGIDWNGIQGNLYQTHRPTH
jgi:hypothetical protein